MNHAVAALVADYARRTLGGWALLIAVQIMQLSTFWVGGFERVPLVGAVIGGIVFFATFEAPYKVMRTLPLSRREVALVRWWGCTGVPALVICAATVLAWIASFGRGLAHPPLTSLWMPAAEAIAALAVISILPLPMLNPVRMNLPTFVLVWGTLAIVGLYGIPLHELPQPVRIAFALTGLALVAATFVRAWAGKLSHLPAPPSMLGRGWRPHMKVRSHTLLRGWPVLFDQLLRSTLIMSTVAVVCISVLRWLFPAFEIALPMVFVSAVGVAGSLIARRWLYAVRTLQCLPVHHNALASIICVTLMAPGLIAIAISSAVNAAVPAWGVLVPLYMLPVFAIIPALIMPWKTVETSGAVSDSVSQWSPLMQIATWPLWTGSFGSLALTQLMPTWFGALAVGLALVFAGVGFLTVRSRIRAGYTFERSAGPLPAE